MQTSLLPATQQDFAFAFEAKRLALGPHIRKRWAWDEAYQLGTHTTRWQQRPWSIIELDGRAIGTVSIAEHADHFRFGEFYLLPPFQGQGIGTQLLQELIARSESAGLPIRLEYLKWNPVGSLYLRHGFKVTSENEIHYFLERRPRVC